MTLVPRAARIAAAAVVTIGFLLSAGPAMASTVVDNQRTVVGTIEKMDSSAKTLTVDTGLKTVTIAFDDKTNIKGGDLAVGKDVRISTTEKDGRRLASSIKVKES